MVLLADDRVEPNMANQNGYTALRRAAVKGHASVVTLLLADERVDPNMTSGRASALACRSPRTRPCGDAAACQRSCGPQHGQPGWQHALIFAAIKGTPRW